MIIAYDADAASSSNHPGTGSIGRCPVGVRVVRLPAGGDPDSILKKEGATVFRRYLDESVDLFTFKLAYILEKAESRPQR